MFRSVRAKPNVDSEDADNAFSNFKNDMKKYYLMGKPNKEREYACKPVLSR